MSHTSSKLVITDGLLLDSVKLDTGVLSASLTTLEATVTAVVGVDDTAVTLAGDVATVLVLGAVVFALGAVVLVL